MSVMSDLIHLIQSVAKWIPVSGYGVWKDSKTGYSIPLSNTKQPQGLLDKAKGQNVENT